MDNIFTYWVAKILSSNINFALNFGEAAQMADGHGTVNPAHKKLSGFESHPPHNGFIIWPHQVQVSHLYRRSKRLSLSLGRL